ncbi:MAG: hypothetical protein KBT53_02155 [Porticoccus sp.]|nr:hypothetical protein [Porticoccus sp.]MBQ0806568.1 hypothetical protein [Porticoccus sp.]
MSGKKALENEDFDLEDEAQEPNLKEVESIVYSDVRRRLEDQLEERRLQKSIQDYDFDLD